MLEGRGKDTSHVILLMNRVALSPPGVFGSPTFETVRKSLALSWMLIVV